MAKTAENDDLPMADRAEAPTLGYASRTLHEQAVHWRLLIFVIAVALRLTYAFQQSSDPFTLVRLPDQIEYWLTGRSLLEGRDLGFQDPETSQQLYAFRMPGYPLLIAACGGQLTAVRAVQALLDGTSALAAFAIARRFRGDIAGIIAGGAVALHPFLIYFSTLLLSETLFTAMLAWGVWMLLSPRKPLRAGGVLLLLLAVFVRPSAIGLGIGAAAVAFWDRPRRAWRSAGAATLAAVMLVVLLSGWAGRNKALLGRPIWTTTNSGYTAYDSFNPIADGSSNQASFRVNLTDPALAVNGVPPERLPLATWTRLSKMGELGRNDFFSRLAWQYAAAHPARAVVLAGMKLMRFWAPWPLSAEFGGRWTYVIAGGGFVVPLFALAAIGVWRGGLGRRTTLILLLPAIYFSLVHTVFVGSLRYRVPCDVPLAVLAAAGVGSFMKPRSNVPSESTPEAA